MLFVARTSMLGVAHNERIAPAKCYGLGLSMQQQKLVGNYPLRAVPVDGAAPPKEEESSFDIRQMAMKIWRGKWIIAVCVLIFWFFAYMYVSQMIPQYRATATVMFDSDQNNVVNLEQVVVTADANDARLRNEMEVLRSTSMIERVVEKLKLDENPMFNPWLRERRPSLKWRIRQLVTIPPELKDLLTDVGILSPPKPKAEKKRDPEAVAERERMVVIGTVLGGYQLEPLQGSKVLQISYTSTNPRMSALLANTLAEEYILGQLDAKLDATRTATSWLSERVDELRLKVQEAEEAVERAKAEQSAQSGQSLEITQQQLQALNGALSVAKNETNNSLARFERLQEAVKEGRDFGAITEFRSSPLIQSYRARLDDLESQRVRFLSSVDETHPTIVRLDAELEEIKVSINDEANSIVEAARSDWIVALARQESTEQEVRELEDLALAQSRDALAIRQLEREADASRILYENFLARLNETDEIEDLQSADARILSPAEPPLGALSTARKRIMLGALVAGLAVGVGIILLLDKLNDTFRSPHQVEEKTGLPVLGTMPSAGRRLNRIDVLRRFRENPKASLAESVRNLRTSILFSNVDKPPEVILFTSSVPREGKSTTSVLVAMTSRQMGKPSIIVDCDLRLPALARILDADDDDPGLLSWVEGSATLDEAIHIDPETGLHVLMTKPSEPRSNINAADILSSNRFEELISELRKRYDRVILDAPPTLVVADARILSAVADAVVYAVRWDHTPRGAVAEGLKELQNVNAPIAGIVLTLMNEAKASRYAYDGYSYYKGRYTDYYIS